MTLIPGRTLAGSTNEMPPLIVETKLRAVPMRSTKKENSVRDDIPYKRTKNARSRVPAHRKCGSLAYPAWDNIA